MESHTVRDKKSVNRSGHALVLCFISKLDGQRITNQIYLKMLDMIDIPMWTVI